MRSIAGTVPGAKPLISLTTADLPTARLLKIQQCAATPLFKPAQRAAPTYKLFISLFEKIRKRPGLLNFQQPCRIRAATLLIR
jgi:hypothetical protein